MSAKAANLRERIKVLAAEYFDEAFPSQPFDPGISQVPVSGKVVDAADLQSLIDAALDMWLTTGRFAEQFERDFAQFCGVRNAILVNSGSSANLAAISALTSPRLGERRLKPGDEAITVATGFPTTVNPIIQNGLVPVFVDVTIPTYNIDIAKLEAALSSKTRLIVLAHTLGNPFDLTAVTDFAKQHDLWLVEDCCDALGAKYGGHLVGTFGDLATASFYPAHHITTGEGGAVLTKKPLLKTLVESFRDWGRDCYCEPGQDNTCGKRYEWQLGDLPQGYDHKYTFSHIGYNLKATDMQAAVGVSQLKKLPEFIAARNANFAALYDGVRDLEEYFILPEATPNSEPSWFGFPLTVRVGAPFSRAELIRVLDDAKIASRLLFAGNLVRQPAYANTPHRVADSLANADFAMTNSFWLGVYPGIDAARREYMIETLHGFVESY